MADSNVEMNLRMARGDVLMFPFVFYIGSDVYTEEPDNIYFTVKKHHYERLPLLQKTLQDGGIVGDDQGTYVVTINPEDTNEWQLGVYEYDIEVVKMPNIKKTFVGTLEVTKEVTHYYNEEG